MTTMSAVRFGLLIALVLVWAFVYADHYPDPDVSTRLTLVTVPIAIAIIVTIIIDAFRRYRRKP